MELKYTESDGCPHCHNKEVIRRFQTFDSSLVCTKCGAVFNSLNCVDPKDNGLFTGIYEPVPVEKLYIKERNSEVK